jgi:uncharacterized protein (DUF983 family)
MNRYYQPPLRVCFFALEDFAPDDPTAHKRVCPACGEGLLLMRRDRQTLELLALDACTLCGQHVVYEDLDKVRAERP